MCVSARIDKNKLGSKNDAKAFGVMPLYGQAAALLGAFWRESSNDGISAGSQGATKPGGIGGLIVCIGEKVERGPIVPHVIGP